MREKLLKRLSNADAVASKEQELRDILYEELQDSCDEIAYDHLGSMLFRSKGSVENPVKLMFAAHMDEVGFLVRHISDIGFLYLIAVGGVLDKSKDMQMVRVTTNDHNKVYGLLNVTRNSNGTIQDMYVDIGCESREEVAKLGIEIGNMVTFASTCRQLNGTSVYAGKAMDDRSGCYVLCEAMKRIHKRIHESEIWMAATSSEEVGVRGGKTASYRIDPDIVVAIDVANHPELVRNYTNHRLLGKGCMIVHYDKTMAPNEKLLAFVKNTAKKYDIPYQCDMFSGGGTDAGNGHLIRSGKLAIVIGIPLRCCHGAWSLVHAEDIDHTVELVVELATTIRKKEYESFIDFQGGRN